MSSNQSTRDAIQARQDAANAAAYAASQATQQQAAQRAAQQYYVTNPNNLPIPQGTNIALDTPAGRALYEEYKKSGVVFDDKNNVIYNPADLGAAQVEQARAVQGLAPNFKQSGEPSRQYQQSLLDSGVSSQQLQDIMKDRRTLAALTSSNQAELRKLAQEKETLQKEYDSISEQIKPVQAEIDSINASFSQRFSGQSYMKTWRLQRSVGQDTANKVKSVQDTKLNPLKQRQEELSSRLGTISSREQFLGDQLSSASVAQKSLLQAENRANFDRTFGTSLSKPVDRAARTSAQSGASAGVKSITSPIKYTPLQGSTITARQLKQMGDQPATPANLYTGRQAPAPFNYAGKSTIGSGKAPSRGKGYAGLALNPQGKAQGAIDKQLSYQRSISGQLGSPVNTFISQKKSQTPSSEALGVPVDRSTSTPIKQQTNYSVSLFEGLNVGEKPISRYGPPPAKGTNYNIGVPSGPILITDEEGKVTGIAGSLEQIYGEKKPTPRTFQQNASASIKALTASVSNRPVSGIEGAKENIEGLKVGAVRSAFGFFYTTPRALMALAKEGEKGYNRIVEGDEKFLTRMVGPSSLSEIISGQPVSRSPQYAQGEIFAEIAPAFVTAGLGIGPLKPGIPKTPVPIQTTVRPANYYRQVSKNILTQDKAEPGFVSQTIQLGRGTVKTPGSNAMSAITGKKQPPSPPAKPTPRSTDIERPAGRGQVQVLQKPTQTIPKQMQKPKPTATYVKLGQGKATLVKAQKPKQTQAELISKRYFASQGAQALFRQRAAQRRISNVHTTIYGTPQRQRTATAIAPPQYRFAPAQELKQPQRQKVIPRLTQPPIQRYRFDYPPYTPTMQTTQNPPPQQPPTQQPPPRRIPPRGPPTGFFIPPYFPYGGGRSGRGQKKYAGRKYIVNDISTVIPRGTYFGADAIVSKSPSIFRKGDVQEEKYLRRIERAQKKTKRRGGSSTLKFLIG